MKTRLVVPGKSLLVCCLLLAGVAALVPLVPATVALWRVLLLTLGLLVVVNLLVRPRPGSFRIARRFESLNHIGRESTYRFSLRNVSDRYLTVEVAETLPPELDGDGLRFRILLAPGREVSRKVRFVGLRRGEHRMPPPHLRVSHPLGLVEYQEVADLDHRVRVVPGRPAGETEWILTRVALLEETEVRRSRKRGSAQDFESMREYVTGDEIRRIDWKASARRFRPMVRQYESERGAEVILALDCGRLMGNLVGGVSKLDLAMTPLLDLAAVALRRKERLGFLAFDSEARAFVPPRAGLKHVNLLLSALAGLPNGERPTSYLRAVRYLEARHRKRSLILVFTDFTDEITAQELEASLIALTGRHVVIFVGVSDTHLEALVAAPQQDTPTLFEKGVAAQLILERRRTIARMEQRGIFAVDADPMRLSGPLIRRYLDVRLRGAL